MRFPRERPGRRPRPADASSQSRAKRPGASRAGVCTSEQGLIGNCRYCGGAMVETNNAEERLERIELLLETPLYDNPHRLQ